MILICLNLREDVAHRFNKSWYELINERLVHAKIASEAGGTAQEFGGEHIRVLRCSEAHRRQLQMSVSARDRQ